MKKNAKKTDAYKICIAYGYFNLFMLQDKNHQKNWNFTAYLLLVVNKVFERSGFRSQSEIFMKRYQLIAIVLRI